MYTLNSVTPMNFDALWRDHFKVASRIRRVGAESTSSTGLSSGNTLRKRKFGDSELTENITATGTEPSEGDRAQIDE